MNLSLLHRLKKAFLLSGLAILLTGAGLVQGQGQDVEYLLQEVVLGDTLEYTFYSNPPFLPEIDQYNSYPVHGIADLPGNGPLGVAGWNTLTYVPTVNHPVIDTIYIQYWKFENGWYFDVILTIEIHVLPAIIHAIDDYAETEEGVGVTIPVLANDWTNSDTMKIADVVLVNNGSYTLNADSTAVTFTPASGFSGIAHFNYTICEENGTCDMATVAIAVMGNNIPMVDTMELVTRKNTAREILFPLDGFELLTGPVNGTIDTSSEDYPLYIPNNNFSGNDQFTFQKVDGADTYLAVVQMTVLPIAPPNTFVYDDFSFTTQEEPITVDVVANDVGGDYLMNVNIITQPQHGTASSAGFGLFEYTPDPGFAGVDYFVYRAFSPNGTSQEYGKVFVTVSNFEPGLDTFQLSTPKDVPLVIQYAVPVNNYDFTVIVEPVYGEVVYYPGFQEIDLNGQTFSGYNMLVYTPDPGAPAGLVDEFQLEYCVTGVPCPAAITKVDITLEDIAVAPDQYCLGANCVWAGDTNNDGVVDIKDILPLGLAMGEVGESRPNPDLNYWFGQFGDNWNDVFSPSPVDLKYIDTDGNGIIGGADTAAISQFYGKQHSLVSAPVPPSQEAPLYFYETSVTPVEGGDLVVLDIWLGDPNEQVAQDIFGFTFSLQYETEYVIPESVSIQFLEESWMTYNSPVLYLTKKPVNGKIDAGFTRTGAYSETGYGVVATLEFVVIEDLEGVRIKDDYINLNLTDILAMNANGQTYRLPDSQLRIPIAQPADDMPKTANLVVFPNPSTGLVTVHLNGGVDKQIEELALFATTGELILRKPVGAKTDYLDLSRLPNGIYFLRSLTTSGEVVAQKLEIIH